MFGLSVRLRVTGILDLVSSKLVNIHRMWPYSISIAAQLHLTVLQCAQNIWSDKQTHNIRAHWRMYKRDLRSLRSPRSPRWSVKCTVPSSNPRSVDGFGSLSQPSDAFKSIPTKHENKAGKRERERGSFHQHGTQRNTASLGDKPAAVPAFLIMVASICPLGSGREQRN